MNKDDFPPVDFSFADLVGNRELVRDLIRFKEQLEAMEVLVACEKRHLSRSETGENMVLDLRVELPAAPVLTVTENDPVLTLTWTLSESGYTGMYVERSLDGITFVPLANLAGDILTYDDAAVVVGTEYFYRVRGRRCGIHSLWSNIDSGELVAAVGYALWGAGGNSEGTLGLNNTTQQNSFVQSGADDTWVKIAVGLFHALGVRADGTLWSVGGNYEGELGQGDTTQRDEWTQIGSDTDWAEVGAGGEASFAIKTDGTLWAWGSNFSGGLGLGDTTSRNSPEQVGSDIDWAKVAVGNDHTIALKTTGTLWGAGLDHRGQLGDGATSDQVTFVQETTAATDWAAIACGVTHSAGLKAGGTLFAWGSNESGQLGNGSSDALAHSTPTQVGSATDWTALTAGGNPLTAYTMALKTAGTLWYAGWDFASYVSGSGGAVVQWGSDSDWDIIAGSGTFVYAIKTAGTLWGWGSNANGQLGQGAPTGGDGLEATPLQIGSDTDWASLPQFGQESDVGFALKTP